MHDESSSVPYHQRLAQARSLAYHRAIAEQLQTDPALVGRAKARAQQLAEAGGRAAPYARQWVEILSEVGRMRPTWARAGSGIAGLCARGEVAAVFGRAGRAGVSFVDLSNPAQPREFGKLKPARDEPNRGQFVAPGRLLMFAPHAPVRLVDLVPGDDQVVSLGNSARLNAQCTEVSISGGQALFFAARQTTHDKFAVLDLAGESLTKLGSFKCPDGRAGSSSSAIP